MAAEGKENSDDNLKKRIIFIRHGNSIWNKMKGQGTKSKLSAVTTGVIEFAKTTYYDQGSHKSSTVMDAPLSDIGIKQSKKLSKYLPLKFEELQNELLTNQNYIESHKECNRYLIESSKLVDNILLPINTSNNISSDINKDLNLIQEYLNKCKSEMSSSINEFQKKIVKDIQKIENLISILNVLMQSTKDSIMICSNLRRAISTSIISFWQRFESNKKEKLFMLDCLNELGYGLDSISKSDSQSVAKESSINNFVKGLNKMVGTPDSASSQTPKKDNKNDDQKMELSQFEQDCDDLNMLNNIKGEGVNSQKMRKFYETRLKKLEINTKLAKMSNEELKKKDKLENRKESDRKIELFMDWVFNDKSNENISTIIAVGHSHWIRAFFNKYLNDEHELKRNKVKNTGIVCLDIYRDHHFKNNKVNQYSILPESIITIYEGSL